MMTSNSAMATIAPELTRSDAKRRAILDVASEVFLAQGYAATSMSEIAARVGGSKGTLYNHFRSKEELFSACIALTCQGPAMEFFDPLPPIGEGRSVRDSLIELGISLMEFLQVEQMVAMHRLVLAEVGRFPEIGPIFYEAGPKKGELRFEEYFEAAMAAGHVPAGDPAMVGQRLKDLVMSGNYMRRLWGVETLTSQQLHAHVAESVDIFLRAFAPAEAA
ncbi:MAG TPA: TetR/AcrR family transcriptional regulator [Caulobacteraceae bacterium]|jgi:AcrR family transcriptional regulator